MAEISTTAGNPFPAQAGVSPTEDSRPALVGACDGKSGYTRGCKCAKCEAQRAKWRSKKKSPGNPFVAGVSQPVATGGPALSIVATAPGSGGPMGVSSNHIPWTSDTLKPLFKVAVPAFEKMDVSSLKDKASKISPDAARIVGEDAPWPEATKVILVESGSAGIAEVMNDFGVSAKYANLTSFAVAVASILANRVTLSSKLDEMLAEMKRAKGEEKKAA